MRKILAGLVIIVGLMFSSAESHAACDNTAQVNVTAAGTTQVVGVAGSMQSVHLCGFSVSMSAAGTAKWVQGTGTDCATGQSNLTPAVTLATGTPWTVFISTGYIFRTTPGTALCLSAVTGNVTGFVNWDY